MLGSSVFIYSIGDSSLHLSGKLKVADISMKAILHRIRIYRHGIDSFFSNIIDMLDMSGNMFAITVWHQSLILMVSGHVGTSFW